MASRIPRLPLHRLPRIPSQQVLLMSSGRGARRRAGCAVLALLASLALLCLYFTLRPGARHVLVIDAGSSGTRMYAYTWREGSGGPVLAAVPSTAAPHKVPRRAAPGKRAYQRVETEPGLDRFVDDAAGLRSTALGPLLEWAEAVVPRRQWRTTPVFLFGTAGLRKLSEEQQARLLEGARGVLAGSGLRFRPAWARIITGADEGVYGWIALNYLEGRLQAAAAAAAAGQQGTAGGLTLGALDLGGSSLEVTFASDTLPGKDDGVNATLLGASHQLYAHVHHHYGLNDAFDRAVNILLNRLAPAVERTTGTDGSTADGDAAGGRDPVRSGSLSPDKLREQQQQQQAQQAGASDGLSAAKKAAVMAGVDAAAGHAADKAGEEQQAGASSGGARRRLAAEDGAPQQQQAQQEEQQAQQGQRGQRGRHMGEEVPVVEHPCLHRGYRREYHRLRGEGADAPVPERVVLVGRPDFAACQQLALAVVDASAPCEAPPCALGTPQPTSARQREFVALTGFFVVYRFFRLPSGASMAQLEQAGRAFCGKSWSQVQGEYSGEIMMEDYCFRAPYIAALVHQGLLLRDEQLRIGGGDVGWTLGAALAEGYRLAGMGQASGGTVFSRSAAAPLLLLLAVASGAAAVLFLVWPLLRQRWLVFAATGGPSARALAWVLGRCGVLRKLPSKGSAELISLGIDSPPSSSRSSLSSSSGTGLAGLVYPGSLSSRVGSPLPTARSPQGRLTARSALAAGQTVHSVQFGAPPGSAGAATGGGGGGAGAGALAAAAEPASLAGSPSWASQRAVPVVLAAVGSSGGSPAVGRESSYSSNLNRLGHSRNVSRRALAASQEGE